MYSTINNLDVGTTLRRVLIDLNIEKLLEIKDPNSLTDEEKIKYFNYILENLNLEKKHQTITITNVDVEIDEDDAFNVLTDTDLINELEHKGYVIQHKSDIEYEINFNYNENDLFEDFKEMINKHNYWFLKEKFKQLL